MNLSSLMEKESNPRNLRRAPYDAQWIALCRLVQALTMLEEWQEKTK